MVRRPFLIDVKLCTLFRVLTAMICLSHSFHNIFGWSPSTAGAIQCAQKNAIRFSCNSCVKCQNFNENWEVSTVRASLGNRPLEENCVQIVICSSLSLFLLFQSIPNRLRIFITSRNRFKIFRNTFYYTTEPIFPPHVFKSIEPYDGKFFESRQSYSKFVLCLRSETNGIMIFYQHISDAKPNAFYSHHYLEIENI